MESNPTEELAQFAAELSYDDLPETVREKVRHLLADSVACALAGDLSDEVPGYTRFARAAGGEGESTVIGSHERLSPLGATLLNGYLITAVTACDVYVPCHVHVTPEVVPPALAIAERDGVDGRTLLAALAIGTEVTVRLADALDYPVARKMGWHLPGIVGPFGAAAAVGTLRGLSGKRLRNAFGLAGSQAAGTWASWGTPAVKFHQSRGAVSGLMAAVLAEEDFQASADIIAHPDGGLLAAYSGGGKVDAAVDQLGERWQMEQISLRLWPAGTPLQSALTALSELNKDDRVRWPDIAHVAIHAAPRIYDTHTRFIKPEGFFEAAQSYPFIAAVTLRDGYYWLDRVRPEHYADPDLTGFINDRVELVSDPALAEHASRIAVTLSSGEVITAEVDAALGSPQNPASRADVEEKLARCVDGRMAKADGDQLADLLLRVDELDDLAPIFGLLREAGERRP